MNILVLGAYNSCNLGDAVICECVAHMLQKRFPEAHITIKDFIHRNRLIPRREPDVHSMKKRRIHSSIRRIIIGIYPGEWDVRREKKRVESNISQIEQVCRMETDLVVVAGGQLFMDRYALFLEAYLTKFADRGIPVIINACGTGPNMSKEIAIRLKATLMHPGVKKISCRDDVDLVNGCYLAAGKKADATFDPALAAWQIYSSVDLEQSKSGCIGLGVKEPNGKEYKKTITFWQNIIRLLEKRGIRWQFFTNGDPIDKAFARAVIHTLPELKERENELLRPCDIRPEELVETIKSYDGLISFRLHSHIIAAALNIPTVAVVWDEKLLYFFEKIGCPERCVTIKHSPQKVFAIFERACKEGYDIDRIRHQEDVAAKWLLEAVEEVMELEFPKEKAYE